MPLFLRMFFLSTGLLLTAVGAVASIAVFNTWRLYSFPTAPAIALEIVTTAIYIAGAWVVSVAIRYRDPRKVKKVKPTRWPYESFANFARERTGSKPDE
jgi:hypothetical protein